MMYRGKAKSNLIKFTALILLALIAWSSPFTARKTGAMPFYNLKPEKLTLRSSFYTTYATSTDERKSNIALAAKSLNGTFVDVGAEFSFNRTVGERTVKRGYKVAKIIVGGEFVDGVGGGVCQVSTTLYNAILLAGLKITEYHAHSLPVSYVAPSFDAMVNSGSADLRFINDTFNPIIIYAHADGQRLLIEIHGQKQNLSIERYSVVTERIPCEKEQVIVDEKGEYPDLFVGEYRFIKYGKAGYKSEGYIVAKKDGKVMFNRKIRSDKYNSTRGIVVYGTAVRKNDGEDLLIS